MGFGCRAFYGVKAVRFIMGAHSQLKYGARLINSYLGDNSTISCCEVLNSLIFPAHEQHHNNSFLTAATVMGQSNIAAGATIGSNHNSRSPDGELMAGRGFWPGLCVSLKHNSKFACFSIVAKGDYPAELNIPIPFSLISNDVTNNRLVIMPAYWFMYNMYAMERNGWKYSDRDKRKEKVQHLEYNYLAPDSVTELVEAIKLLEKFTGKAWFKKNKPDEQITADEITAKGKHLLQTQDSVVNELEILADCFENTKRKTVIIKVLKGYKIFKELVQFYLVSELINVINKKEIKSFNELINSLPKDYSLTPWMNVGGQLIPRSEIDLAINQIHDGTLNSWEAMHQFYGQQANVYNIQKLAHALAAYAEVYEVHISEICKECFNKMLCSSITTREWMTEGIYNSRAKDYANPFRKMTYENKQEMEAVVGKLEDNSFIRQQRKELENYKQQLTTIINWNV